MHPSILLPALVCLIAADGLDAFLKNLDVEARIDLSGFSARISSQFQVGEGQVRAVLGAVGSPADAFMVFQLGQFSAKPVDQVLQVYKAGKGKGRGWGELAKELGIKPGSAEFHALKQGNLRLDGQPAAAPAGKGKGKGKGRWAS